MTFKRFLLKGLGLNIIVGLLNPLNNSDVHIIIKVLSWIFQGVGIALYLVGEEMEDA